ncbi:MAG: hypothetical protein KF861_09785 [Planctomycetaceae bacterium]|nr:hypothetical protein [Planctomycetaceae bacterium]
MQMRSAGVVTGILLSGSVFCASVGAADPIRFEPQIDLLQVPGHIVLGGVSAVAVNSRGQVFMLHRAEHPVVCFEADGKYVRSWGSDLIGSGHGLRIDRDDNVWVTDTDRHLVFKFDPHGDLLMTLGEPNQPGLGQQQFNKPTDVNFGPEGELYVTDGYGNSRVVKFTSKGEFVTTWGDAGSGPGQFNSPHAVVIDPQGRVVIADRDNNRIQIFDPSGKLLETWTGFTPFGVALDADGVMFVADGKAQKILQLDEAGHVVQSWGGERGTAAGEFSTPHMLEADRQGNLYAAEVGGKRVQKLVRQQ